MSTESPSNDSTAASASTTSADSTSSSASTTTSTSSATDSTSATAASTTQASTAWTAASAPFSFAAAFGSSSLPQPFSFASNSSSTPFSFGALSSVPPIAATSATAPDETTASSADGANDEAEVAPEEASTAEYTPVVRLPTIETSSGEENETVLYKHRAALYRFDSAAKEWKERGRGDLKLLQHNESKRVRVLLRQDKTLKVCMNHAVYKDIVLRPNAGSDRSWTWRCDDYSEHVAETQTFALRFKDAETANTYKTEYDECREINAKLAGSTAAKE